MSFFKEIADVLGLDEAKLALGYHYITYNGAAVYVEGVKRLLRIDGEEMVLQIPKGVLHIAGRDLTVAELNGASILVRGEVAAVYTSGVWQSEQGGTGA